MATYHVFVDGAVDATTEGNERLAKAIAEHYGLPVADLRTRIASGRFRVKGNCDQATADMYVRDLTHLGATCSTEEATPQNRANTPLPFPAVGPGARSTTLPPATTAPSARPTLPPTQGARATTPPTGSRTTLPPATATAKPAARTTLPPATAKPAQPAPPGGYQSGLAAAFSSETPAASLGALEAENFAFTLSSVDGGEDAAPPPAKPASFEPPGATTAEPAAKPERAPKTTKQAAPKDAPLDMFAPPESQGEGELKFDLEPEEIERAARKRASTPPPSEPAPVATDSGPASDRRYSRPSLQAPNTAVAPAATRSSSPLANPNLRMIAGVVIAVVLGFVPAHLVAAAREKSAFEAVDTKVIETQKEADSPETYAALDKFRTDQLARKHDDRRSIAIMAMLIWAAAGGAIGYVWFRRIPWDRFDHQT